MSKSATKKMSASRPERNANGDKLVFRKSAKVPLLLLGVGSLAIGGKYLLDRSTPTDAPIELRRDYYETLADCSQEWDPSQGNCTVSEHSNPRSPGLHYYPGPSYYLDRQSGRPIGVAYDGQTRTLQRTPLIPGGPTRAVLTDLQPGYVDASGRIFRGSPNTRGGFGASAHAFSSSGG